jgi:small-conductance mechanosensitive channel
MRTPSYLVARAALALTLMAAPGLAAAQTATADPADAAQAASGAPDASLAEAVGDAGVTQAQLREIETALAPDDAFKDLAATAPQRIADLEERAAGARERIEQATHLRQLQDVENYWIGERERIEAVREQLTDRALAIREGNARIDELAEVWEKTRQEARELEAPAAALAQIGRTIHAAQTARAKVAAYAAEVLELQADIGGALGVVARVLERARLEQQAIRGGLLGTDDLPLWTAIGERRRDFGEIFARVLEIRRSELVDARDYAAQELPEILLHATLLVLAVLAALALRPRALRWAAEDENSSPSAELLSHPYAAGALLAAMAWPILYPNAPSNWKDLFLLIALVASLRLLPRLIEPEIRPAFYALAAFFLVDRIRDMLGSTPLLARGIFAAELVGFAAVLVFLLRTQRLALLPNSQARLPVFVFARRLALLLIGVAFGSSVLGYSNLSRLVGNGVMFSAYGGIAVYGAYKVLSGMVGIFLRGRAFAQVRVIEGHREGLTRALTQILRYGALGSWLYASLGLFEIREPLAQFVGVVLTSGLSVGKLRVSLGGTLVFVISVVIAVYGARFVRYVLDEDVLPRLSLPRGVPYAISGMTFYVLLTLGVLAAIAAAGIDLSGFALLGGALGVGIGFGLQNVVNNFVSGLILLFERPIKTGDTIELGTLLGEVRQIGIRASTVRTWQGADVIVPNANLISDQVINWTLSDRNRRIEIDVGVAYGTDPERVLQLLTEVAAEEDRILERPAPSALFVQFGESSLDFRLRAWTARPDEWMRIRSDLNVAVNRALGGAEIEIPFPQRDLHLRSVDAQAGQALAAQKDRS